MDHILTEKHRRLKEKTRGFVEKEISSELALAIEAADEFPFELMQKLADQGFMGINVPEEYGGLGGGVIDEMVFFEEITKGLPVLAWTAGDIILYGNNIIKTNGNKAQQEAYLPKLAKGEMIFCFALTEPDAGSDAASIQTAAEKIGDHYVINGNKVFISGAGVADIAVTNTRTAPGRYDGITAFLVDTKSEGYSATPMKKLGYKGSNTCEVYYNNVNVAPQDILGGEDCLNQGWRQMMRLLNGERLTLSSCALGIGERILADVIAYVRDRIKLSRPTGKFQDIEHQVVEMATELEAARQLAYYAAWKETRKMECVRETSMSKYLCAETGKKIAITAMQIMGDYAYTMACDVQRYFRDVSILSIGGGTTQIQKNIIAKTLGL
ncbi:MAG: acyl-CoA dehydrogenase family protein [Desulfobacterales bacterium]|jgi:alkylation response protein AidB-like acyl-CoA dehydrogenase